MTSPAPRSLFQRLWGNPYLLLVLAVSFWAGNAIIGRAVHGVVPPVGMAFFRWIGASLIILPFAWPHLKRDWAVAASGWPWLAVLAACGIGAFNTFLYIGLQYTQAINSLLMQSAIPVLIVVLSFVIFRQRISAFQGIGTLVSLTGVLLIITAGHPERLMALDLNRGDLWVLAAVAAYAVYSVFLQKRPAIHPLGFVALTFVIGTVMLAPFAAWETWGSGRAMDWGHPYTWMAVGYVSVFPSIFSYLCFNRGVELLGANTAGLFIHLNPLFGSLLAIVFLGETFALHHGLGMALILGGIFLANRRAKARRG
ncbi:DMT family transporter [Insolitispirillum peregrinum]|uniref:Permease of the drug/metabolite transporter (DMT) superfamily n=1 Tax=Insolitispirillum peregrinum TaxID=80876 RepID=A0A1N7JG06_9PROT|nr:DMT family transporter [Insolitispirillum peregrinum]SIS48312.1 Permease of the drug/metabolite transporter (DMT) superfamily [Insolitispirillum peregrinum]